MPPSPGPCTISPPIRKWSRRWVECRAPGRRAELEDDDRLRLRARTRHRISGVGSARQAAERGPSSDPDSSGRGSERDEDHRGSQGGAPDRSAERGEGDWPNRWLPGQPRNQEPDARRAVPGRAHAARGRLRQAGRRFHREHEPRGRARRSRSARHLLRRRQRHDLRRRATDLEGRRHRGVRLLQDQDDREPHGGLPPDGETGDERGWGDPPVQGAGRLRPVVAVRQRRRHRPRRLRGEQGARRPLSRPGRRGAEDPYGSRCPHHRAAPGRLRPVTLAYRIRAGDGRSTEELVAAGNYGYAHSCVTSDNFPVRPTSPTVREIVLLAFDREVSSEDAIAEATRHDLARPEYEDALYFGAAYPDVQRERPVVFLHEPWLRSEEHTSELQSPDHLVCRLLLEKKKRPKYRRSPT